MIQPQALLVRSIFKVGRYDPLDVSLVRYWINPHAISLVPNRRQVFGQCRRLLEILPKYRGRCRV